MVNLITEPPPAVETMGSPLALLDTFNHAFFYTPEQLPALRHELADRLRAWLAPGAPLPAPGWRLYTGERVRTRFPGERLLMLELAHALLRLDGESPQTQAALRQVETHIRPLCFAVESCIVGECAHAAAGVMRYLAAGGQGVSLLSLDAFLAVLAANRDGQGRWRNFPFYYTLLALTEIPLPAAHAELQYTAPAIQRVLLRLQAQDAIDARRRAVVERALECGAPRQSTEAPVR